MAKPNVDLIIESPLWEKVAFVERAVLRAAEAVGAYSEVARAIRRGDELCITLLDDEEIAALNSRWRGKNAPTNVLSFPARMDPDKRAPRHLGDIALAFETIENEAANEGKAFDDHVMHLVVHGVLHLLGYDHLNEGDAQRMETIEARILASIGVANPYATEAA